jgi:BT1 family
MLPNQLNDKTNDLLAGGLSGPRRSTPTADPQQQHRYDPPHPGQPLNAASTTTATTTTATTTGSAAAAVHPPPSSSSSLVGPQQALPPQHPATAAAAVSLVEEEEPIDTADANAEAARLARELGVASSVQGTRQKEKEISPKWSLRRLNSNGSSSGSASAASNNNNPSNNANTTAMAYHRMTDESMNSTNTRGAWSAGGSVTGGGSSIAASYIPPNHHHKVEAPPIIKEPIHHYDAHGQRAPYQEGAYIISRDKDGRVYKRRWCTYYTAQPCIFVVMTTRRALYAHSFFLMTLTTHSRLVPYLLYTDGRMEDGYIAWSSIYLHEYFGFEIYTPLTKEQEDDLKKPGAQVPRWMYEFTSLPSLAIPVSYFCIGVALQLLRTPLIVYFIEDLNATAAEVNVLFTVMAVPWCFKVIYGFLSDCVPISGLRRKPYFMTGWLVYIASNLILMIPRIPSIQLCILLVFAQTAGYMLADVMTDALIVERSRYETEETRGTMQSTGYIIRFFGSTIGAAIGAVVYNKDDWSWYLPIRLVFFINAAFPMIFLVPIVPYLLELDGHCIGKTFGYNVVTCSIRLNCMPFGNP